MSRRLVFSFAFISIAISSLVSHGEDWPRFRGPDGNGVTSESVALPTQWSPNANIAWKTEMPGPGASSPIIIGDKAFVTCYSGYGLERQNPGDIENLVRHLVCIDMKDGKKLWQKDVAADTAEDPYTGIGVTAHGYASHTPVSDGKNIYAFFGKSGVHAFDLDGNELWQADVGKESDMTKWGSSSSPILYKNTVIVTASYESQAIIGLDKESGNELWRQEAKGLDGMWGTPTLVKVDDDRTDLVMCVARELWGLDPDNGKMRWFAKAGDSRHAYTSVVLDGKRVYAFNGGRTGGGSVAVDVGGTGDISETHTVWAGNDRASFASPVRHESKLYVVAGGTVNVVDAQTGKSVEKTRLKGVNRSGGRALDYPSPVVAGDHMYYMNGKGQMFVFSLGDELEQVALNQVTNEQEIFWGSPAISNGRMVLRSAKYVYCVADKGETVKPEDNMLAKAGDAEEEPEARGGGRGRGRRGGGGGRRRFDPDEFFKQLDSDEDGKISESELEGNRIAERLKVKTLDKDEDKFVSKEEFTAGISGLLQNIQRQGGRRRAPQDTRPDRPQRPKSANG